MRPYSEDLRERAVRRAEAGETIRSIAEALQISPSCVSKWRKRLRETGALTPDQVGATWAAPRRPRAAWPLEDADLHRRPAA